MLSRVADSLYWMSRYLERAEHTAAGREREPQPHARPGAGRCGAALGPVAGQPARAAAVAAQGHAVGAVERATVDLANRESIAACVGAARENARQVREEISSEMWEEINRLFLAVQQRQPVDSEWTAGTHEFLTATISGVHQIQGVTDATMTHGEGWHYIELGRYLERASATAALLDVQFREAPPDPERAHRGQRVRRVGRAAEVVLRLRGLLPALHRRRAAAAHRRVPGAQSRVPAQHPLRGGPRADHAQGALPASPAASTGGPTGWPAGCWLRSTTDKSTRSWASFRRIFKASCGRPTQINAAVHQQYIAYPIDTGLA